MACACSMHVKLRKITENLKLKSHKLILSEDLV
jgi:CO dehydrogenase nickel-insertion accessory protein CooC1